MIWDRVDHCHWRCEDYKKDYAISAKVSKKTSSWAVYYKDKRLKAGRQPHVLESMKAAIAFIDKHQEEQHGKDH